MINTVGLDQKPQLINFGKQVIVGTEEFEYLIKVAASWVQTYAKDYKKAQYLVNTKLANTLEHHSSLQTIFSILKSPPTDTSIKAFEWAASTLVENCGFLAQGNQNRTQNHRAASDQNSIRNGMIQPDNQQNSRARGQTTAYEHEESMIQVGRNGIRDGSHMRMARQSDYSDRGRNTTNPTSEDRQFFEASVISERFSGSFFNPQTASPRQSTGNSCGGPSSLFVPGPKPTTTNDRNRMGGNLDGLQHADRSGFGRITGSFANPTLIPEPTNHRTTGRPFFNPEQSQNTTIERPSSGRQFFGTESSTNNQRPASEHSSNPTVSRPENANLFNSTSPMNHDSSSREPVARATTTNAPAPKSLFFDSNSLFSASPPVPVPNSRFFASNGVVPENTEIPARLPTASQAPNSRLFASNSAVSANTEIPARVNTASQASNSRFFASNGDTPQAISTVRVPNSRLFASNGPEPANPTVPARNQIMTQRPSAPAAPLFSRENPVRAPNFGTPANASSLFPSLTAAATRPNQTAPSIQSVVNAMYGNNNPNSTAAQGTAAAATTTAQNPVNPTNPANTPTNPANSGNQANPANPTDPPIEARPSPSPNPQRPANPLFTLDITFPPPGAQHPPAPAAPQRFFSTIAAPPAPDTQTPENNQQPQQRGHTGLLSPPVALPLLPSPLPPVSAHHGVFSRPSPPSRTA